MDGEAWKAAVHGVSEGRARLSDFTFTFHFHALEEEMATHSSVLAWRIPGMGEPGGLLSMGSRRVGHDWNDLAAAAACMKCSLGVSNFLEEISSLSHSVVFLYFFALISEEGFLISPCYSLELCVQMGLSFFFSFAFIFCSNKTLQKICGRPNMVHRHNFWSLF